MVLDQATWLKNTPFGIHEQFPKPIELSASFGVVRREYW
jgi:hypothetical protein